MQLDWSQGALHEGLRCYRNRKFFEAHEHWEAVWLAAKEPEKTFLQGLIQMAAAFHHYQRGNRLGSASLLRAALQRLERYPGVFGGIAVAPLREEMRAWLDALKSGAAESSLAFPELRGSGEN